MTTTTPPLAVEPEDRSEYEIDLQRRLRDAVGDLASGCQLVLEDDCGNSWRMVAPVKQPQGDVLSHLFHCGWLETMPNGGTCKLSDAGKLAYLKSTDELGDGKLIAPHEWRN